ncbi:restriction endonuclease subunit S [Enterococcus faecalis]|uniref:restriction endonuclease subunit S n=1 Tax=Enterococcus faecalis TaxID=1351 RepID=UPI00293613C9|nr:restriction endonuclease subunit S [Enterococcus faecalis]MDV2931851.1 restriction endonuclease subunit S [Enterococcus faecalis]
MRCRLNELATFVTEKINVTEICLENYISTENMLPNKEGVFKSDKLPNVKRVNRYEKGDILVSNIRPYFKKIWYADTDGGCSTDVLVFRATSISSKLLFSLLFQDYFFERMMLYSKGTKMPRGDKKAIMKIEFNIPFENKQEKIVNIFFNINSKIQINTDIINTLEETATTLFNHWFIDFEFPNKNGNPYKSSGGKMIESELGEIPEGWEVKNLGDLVTFEYGKALKKENRLNGKYPVYGSGGVVGYHNEYLINGPSIIVGRKGTVGSIYYSEENSFPIDTTFWIKPKLENLSMGFTLLILKNQDFSNLISDSAVPGLNRNVAYQNKVIFPAEKIMLEFNAINNSLLKNINSLKKENETLKELRDTLLPKLLSGEIELE